MTTNEAIEEFRIATKNKKDFSIKDSIFSERFFHTVFNKKEKIQIFFSQDFIYFYLDNVDEYVTYDNLEEFVRDIKNSPYNEWEKV